MLESVHDKAEKKRKRSEKSKEEGTSVAASATESEEHDTTKKKPTNEKGLRTRISSGKLIMPLRMINNWFNRKLKFIEVSLFVLELLKEKKASSQPFSLLD